MIDAATDPRLSLRARIRAIEKRLTEIDAEQARLKKLLATYKSLLGLEDALVQQGAANADGDLDESIIPAFHPTRDRYSLADLILRVLGTGPKTLEELKEIGADSWPPVKHSKFPGRAINFALVGLQKGNHVERLKDGRWKLVSPKGESEEGHSA